MPVPTTNEFHRPILEIAAETVDALSARQFAEELAQRLDIIEGDLLERSASGVRRFADRVQWSMHNLRLAGVLARPSRGKYRITDSGRAFLAKHDGPVTNGDLRQLQADGQRSHIAAASSSVLAGDNACDDSPDITPKDILDAGHERLQIQLSEDIKESVSLVSPTRFERLVLDLLYKMGYGEPEHTGHSGDGGIDGIVNQDALGLEKVYVQAKRYTSGSVGEPEIRNFAGSMIARGATKGVFITTSSFSSTARQTAANVSQRNETMRLVDGDELAQLMIRHGVGVVTEYTYEIKKLDENYFADEE